MKDMIQDTDRNFCAILLDVLEKSGVKDVVCCPGSRNAPLLIAAAARGGLRKHNVVDERSAAFMALGIASVSKKPVAIICTSGTALLNFAPAIAEAFYQSIPLIVISADRPEQWIDQDDSQTLRQFEALSNFVKRSYELPAWGNEDKELLWYANRIANDAMIEALSRRKGPVHINVRLGEPLGNKIQRELLPPRIIEMVSSDGIVNKEIVRGLGERLASSKVMFVAGFLQPDSRLHKAVGEFCSMPNVVAMTETLSNLHLSENSYSVDSVLTAFSGEQLDGMAPDIVVSIGGSLVSRKLKEYLRRNSDKCEHWALGWGHTTSDCFMSLTKRVEADPSRLLHQLAGVIKKQISKYQDSGTCRYGEKWRDARIAAREVKHGFISSAPWSELKAFEIIKESLPPDVNLFLSNGTTVRYDQIVGERLPHATYCNRGVSGIDGSCSTAVGGAKMYKGVTVMITGDMSMAYDISSLGLPEIPDRMKIIVIDNNGGGIFRFIPTTSSLSEREQYFYCAPNLPLNHLAEGYGWEYAEAHDESGLRESLSQLLSSKSKGILKIVCDGELSTRLLKQYMALKVESLEL